MWSATKHAPSPSTPHAVFPLHTPTVLQTPSTLITLNSTALSVSRRQEAVPTRFTVLTVLTKQVRLETSILNSASGWEAFKTDTVHLQLRIQKRLVRGAVRSVDSIRPSVRYHIAAVNTFARFPWNSVHDLFTQSCQHCCNFPSLTDAQKCYPHFPRPTADKPDSQLQLLHIMRLISRQRSVEIGALKPHFT